MGIETIFAVLALFLFAVLLSFFALFAAVAQGVLPRYKCKTNGRCRDKTASWMGVLI